MFLRFFIIKEDFRVGRNYKEEEHDYNKAEEGYGGFRTKG